MSASDILRDVGLDVPEAVQEFFTNTPGYPLGSSDVCDRIVDSADAALDALARELVLAVEHDRQPYPTAWAYEKVCADRDALAREVAHRERIIAHLIAEEHLTPHGREARRAWLDDHCEEEP